MGNKKKEYSSKLY